MTQTHYPGYKSLGHREKAPLVYTVAVVQFERLHELERSSRVVLDALKDDYPDSSREVFTTQRISINGGEVKQTHESDINYLALDISKSWGVIFNDQRLLIQTTRYQHFRDFAERLRKVVMILHEHAGVRYTKSMGIRYIDHFHDEADFREGFFLPEIGNATLNNFHQVYHFTTPLGLLVLQLLKRSTNESAALPGDLIPMAQNLDLQFSEDSSYILDTDHIYHSETLKPLDIEHVIETLDDLHKGASLAFRRMINDKLLNTWS